MTKRRARCPLHPRQRPQLSRPSRASRARQEGQVSDDDEEGELPSERTKPLAAEPPEDYDSADDYDENLYKSQADREELMGMNDLERETILAERYDKQLRRREMLEMRANMREEKAGRKPGSRGRRSHSRSPRR